MMIIGRPRLEEAAVVSFQVHIVTEFAQRS
jgi:hypothetical protein